MADDDPRSFTEKNLRADLTRADKRIECLQEALIRLSLLSSHHVYADGKKAHSLECPPCIALAALKAEFKIHGGI